ncbi:MAG: hypothetical protein VKJ04_11410 [Vampirovibrionales bacterium]|nr:hypothetical protein [Vampirovibrionales bacterium]
MMDDFRSQEQDFAMHTQWFIESVINQNYAIEEKHLPTASQMAVSFHFPAGLASSREPVLVLKRFAARLLIADDESRLILTNQDNPDEYFLVEVFFKIKQRYWFFRRPETLVKIHYQDAYKQPHHYQCVYGWQPNAIALPFIKLLKALTKIFNEQQRLG